MAVGHARLLAQLGHTLSTPARKSEARVADVLSMAQFRVDQHVHHFGGAVGGGVAVAEHEGRELRAVGARAVGVDGEVARSAAVGDDVLADLQLGEGAHLHAEAQAARLGRDPLEVLGLEPLDTVGDRDEDLALTAREDDAVVVGDHLVGDGHPRWAEVGHGDELHAHEAHAASRSGPASIGFDGVHDRSERRLALPRRP